MINDDYARFQSIAQRELCMPTQIDWSGARILVTGGTGCIGSMLMQQLAQHRPERLISVSRGDTDSYPLVPGALYYRNVDIRDRERLEILTRFARPDIIFHTAAQRSPALAETAVHRTVTTNVFGTRNVLHVAGELGVPVVMASTGKAVRPYSPDMYTASKRCAEWLGVCAAQSGLQVSAARFTHVIDNSIIVQRLRDWAHAGEPIRLHSADIAFYVQSAAESAQLLQIASAGAVTGELRVHAIRDLGWPVALMDVAEGVRAELNSASPITVVGYERGYEEQAYPGLYDPATAGDVSPLINLFEAARTEPSVCPMVDAFPLQMRSSDAALQQLALLECACSARDDELLRQQLRTLTWLALDAALAMADPVAVKRSVTVTEPHLAELNADWQRMFAMTQAVLEPAIT